MPLAVSLLLLAVYGQVTLTIALVFILGARRRTALRNKETTFAQSAVDQTAWPESALKAANAFKNQFEIPVLFYVVSLLFLSGSRPDLFVAGIALIFTGSRYVHAFIHINGNNVMKRFYAYFVGVAAVCILWGYFMFSHIYGLMN